MCFIVWMFLYQLRGFKKVMNWMASSVSSVYLIVLITESVLTGWAPLPSIASLTTTSFTEHFTTGTVALFMSRLIVNTSGPGLDFGKVTCFYLRLLWGLWLTTAVRLLGCCSSHWHWWEWPQISEANCTSEDIWSYFVGFEEVVVVVCVWGGRK